VWGRLFAKDGAGGFERDSAAEAGIGGGRSSGDGAGIDGGGGRRRRRAERGAGLAGVVERLWGRRRRMGHGQWAVVGGRGCRGG